MKSNRLKASPAGLSSLGNALRALRRSRLRTALCSTSTSPSSASTCCPSVSSFLRSSSARRGGRASSPPRLGRNSTERGDGKEKTVGEEELSSPTRRVSLEDGPRASGGRHCRDRSCTDEVPAASAGSRGKTTPRKAWSSHRKDKESAGEEKGSVPGGTASIMGWAPLSPPGMTKVKTSYLGKCKTLTTVITRSTDDAWMV